MIEHRDPNGQRVHPLDCTEAKSIAELHKMFRNLQKNINDARTRRVLVSRELAHILQTTGHPHQKSSCRLGKDQVAIYFKFQEMGIMYIAWEPDPSLKIIDGVVYRNHE